jgi:hypothetical protein
VRTRFEWGTLFFALRERHSQLWKDRHIVRLTPDQQTMFMAQAPTTSRWLPPAGVDSAAPMFSKQLRMSHCGKVALSRLDIAPPPGTAGVPPALACRRAQLRDERANSASGLAFRSAKCGLIPATKRAPRGALFF